MIYLNALTLLQKCVSPAQAWWILQHITQKTKESIILANMVLDDEQQKNLDVILSRLQKHEPVAYILGTIPFLDLDLEIQKPMLIPRPETEFFTQYIIAQLQNHHVKNILDLCTGSGCIGLSIAQAFPNVQVTASDISQQACALAQKNAEKNNLKNVSIIQSDLFTHLQNQTFDIIISNPPYIPDTYKNKLDASVLQHEDHGALFSGTDGLDLIKKIIEHAPAQLSLNNLPFKLALEVDASHADKVVELCLQKKFGHAWIMHDQYNRPRFVFAK